MWNEPYLKPHIVLQFSGYGTSDIIRRVSINCILKRFITHNYSCPNQTLS